LIFKAPGLVFIREGPFSLPLAGKRVSTELWNSRPQI
jgi:hypothetical protein